ncbi:MAG: DUF3991 and toprim domain-containing protein [Erysipelotrichaceae bacterium]|nr:DUF3991 and toprim domain-containing protein [Erysipelotrichaceae bacterium]
MTMLSKSELKIRRKNVSKYPIKVLAEELGFTVLKVGRNYLTLKEHDSVRININKNTFKQYSTGAYGDALAFLLQFGFETTNDKRFKSIGYSLNYLEKRVDTNHNLLVEPKEEKQIKSNLVLPEADNNNDAVIHYLLDRCISEDIIDDFIDKGMLYQEKCWNKNCVFVSYDINKNPVYALRRSSNPHYRFVQDVAGSSYKEGFFIDNQSDIVIVTEAVIEAMSLMTLKLHEAEDFNKSSFFCLNSVYKWEALINTLNKNRNINYVVLALNKDEAGRSAVKIIQENIQNRCNVRRVIEYLPDIEGFDWNDYLRERNRLTLEAKSLDEEYSMSI